MTHRLRKVACLVVLLVGLPAGSIARADIITPAGLNPGDEFRMVFVTSTKRNAESGVIADYDDFVTARAVAGGLDTYNGDPVTWQWIGSTATVSAISRLPTTSPALFLPNATSTKIADSGADLWDGSIDNLFNINEFGIVVFDLVDSFNVWTGTNPDGTTNPNRPINLFVRAGSTIFTDSKWVSDGEPTQDKGNRLYGFSEVLTVPAAAAVPEPASLTLMLMGLGGLVGARLARRRRAAASSQTECPPAHC